MTLLIRRSLSACLLLGFAIAPASAQPASPCTSTVRPQSPPDVKTDGAVIKSPRPATPALPARPSLPAPIFAPKPGDLAALRPAVDHSVVHYQAAADGALWARGADYKVRFDAAGASFIPFLSSVAPRSFSVDFALQSIGVGGATLALDERPTPCREGDVVTFARGGVDEIYVLSPSTVEQEFLLRKPAVAGEIVLSIAAGTEFAVEATAEGLEFGNEWGGVRYGRATAVDARGERLLLETSLWDGALQITIPAEFAARAAWPVLVDPVVSSFQLVIMPRDALSPDVAFDQYGDLMYCWEEAYSATDHDVYTERRDRTGALIFGGGSYADFTLDNWTRPRIAYNGAHHAFLIVAMRNAPGSEREVWGYLRWLSSGQNSGQFVICDSSAWILGEKLNPDVGGDPVTPVPSNFMVVFERVYSPTDHDILACTVNGGGLVGPVFSVENSSNRSDTAPAISKSNNGSNWNVVWQFEYSPGDRDIWGARLSWDGTTTNAAIVIDDSFDDATNPSVSSPVPSTDRYVVVYEGDFGTDHDILLRAVDATNILYQVNLNVIDGSNYAQDQRWPSVDFAGDQFICSYSELYANSLVDYDAYCTAVAWLPNLGIFRVEGHQLVADSAQPEIETQVAPEFGSGWAGSSRETAIAWCRGKTSGNNDEVWTARYQPGCGSLGDYCTAGTSTHNCQPMMTWSGIPSASASSGFLIGAYDVEGQQNGIVLYGVNGTVANPWGASSSFLCVRSPTERMSVRASGGTSGACDGAISEDWNAFMAAHPAALGNPRHAGEIVYAQVWYRDPPSPKSSNLSSAAWFTLCP